MVKARRVRSNRPEVQHVLAAIARAHELAQARGIHLVILLFPTKEEVYLPLQGVPTPPPVARWLPLLRHMGVPILDLTVAFRAHADGPPLLFEVDGHANVEGNRVLAAAVPGYLRGHAVELGLGSPVR